MRRAITPVRSSQNLRSVTPHASQPRSNGNWMGDLDAVNINSRRLMAAFAKAQREKRSRQRSPHALTKIVSQLTKLESTGASLTKQRSPSDSTTCSTIAEEDSIELPSEYSRASIPKLPLHLLSAEDVGFCTDQEAGDTDTESDDSDWLPLEAPRRAQSYIMIDGNIISAC